MRLLAISIYCSNIWVYSNKCERIYVYSHLIMCGVHWRRDCFSSKAGATINKYVQQLNFIYV